MRAICSGTDRFCCFLLSRSLSRFSSQIAAVVIGWQIYELTGSAFDLGMVGLVQFLPTALLVFVAGHAADRFERRRVVQVCQLAQALTARVSRRAAPPPAGSTSADLHRDLRARHCRRVRKPGDLGAAAADRAAGTLQRATALSIGAAQVATITGPALGGLAYVVAPSLPYADHVCVFWLWRRVLTGFIRATPQAAVERDRSARTISLPVCASSATIRRSSAPSRSTCLRCCSAASSALLPIYARDILQTGPLGPRRLARGARGRRAAR